MCDLGELQQGMLRLPKKKAEKKKKWGLIIGNSTGVIIHRWYFGKIGICRSESLHPSERIGSAQVF